MPGLPAPNEDKLDDPARPIAPAAPHEARTKGCAVSEPTPQQVADLVRDTKRFKFNCNLVVIDFLVRHGAVDVEAPSYAALVAGLRRDLRR